VSRTGLLCAGILAMLLIGFAAPGQASAARGLTLGFLDDATFFGPSQGSTWLDRARSSDAQLVRVNLFWSRVAPTRPPDPAAADPNWGGYQWTATDAAVRAATSHGLRVLLTIGSAPTWAEAADKPKTSSANPREGVWKPNANALRAFATAAARRYSGTSRDGTGVVLPQVSAWQAWNEPNLALYLAPQWVRQRGKWRSFSPGLYRRLLNSVYAGVKSVQPRATIVTAGTAPYGDPPGGTRMRPAKFTREYLCLHGRRLRLLKCPSPAKFDVLAHHPYSVGGPEQHAINPDDVAVPDLASLTKPLRKAERTRRVLPRGRKALWITEISWDSSPPDPQGVPLARHARWLQESLHALWRQGASVVIWQNIADHPPTPRYDDTYQSGIYFSNGRPKPAAIAFRFPFVGTCARRRCSLWGRAPAPGKVLLERRSAAAWKPVRQLRTNSSGVFRTRLERRGKARLRARIGSETSLELSVR
jgi:hypothetical protein